MAAGGREGAEDFATTDVQPRLAPTGVEVLEGLLDGGRELPDAIPPRRSPSLPRLDVAVCVIIDERSGLGILVSILRMSWTLQNMLTIIIDKRAKVKPAVRLLVYHLHIYSINPGELIEWSMLLSKIMSQQMAYVVHELSSVRRHMWQHLLLLVRGHKTNNRMRKMFLRNRKDSL